MSTIDDDTEYVSTRRLTPVSHLQHAAKSSLGGAAERYHVPASIAESLVRITDLLERIVKAIEREEYP